MCLMTSRRISQRISIEQHNVTAPQILPALSFSTAASSFPNEETTFVLPIASTTRRWVSKRYCLFFLGDIRVADNLQRAGYDRAD